MGRSLIVIAVLLVGCTRPNPAFDIGSDASDEIGEAEETDQGESAEGDLPLEACDYQPSVGLDLKFGDPAKFGGNCPTEFDTWIKILETGGGAAVVDTCDATCTQCSGPHPLSAYPLVITDHLPIGASSGCLRFQANVSLGASPDVCQWGAISIYEAPDATPYVIATAHGSEPTPMGFQTLEGLIPDPVKIAACNCDEVGQSHDCCYQADSPPEFLAYPWGDGYLLPGDYAMIELANQLPSVDHYFHVYQAQRLNICETAERSMSWAVKAKF